MADFEETTTPTSIRQRMNLPRTIGVMSLGQTRVMSSAIAAIIIWLASGAVKLLINARMALSSVRTQIMPDRASPCHRPFKGSKNA
jgi:hypothetical protein